MPEAQLELAWEPAQERKRRRGGPRPFNCFSCGRFKPRPSSVCRSCGDEPVSFNGDRRDSTAPTGMADPQQLALLLDPSARVP